MIHNRQKFLLHLYSGAAGLNEPTYRNVLADSAGVASAADPDLTQTGFERAMAALETMLFTRVHAGQVSSPIGHNKHIAQEFYWRHRLPRAAFINSRQAWKIESLWSRLCDYLPEDQRTSAYLAGILHQATGRVDTGYESLTMSEATCLIDALRDCLSWSLRSRPERSEGSNIQHEEELQYAPF